jgi:hypothetical protein
MSVCAFECHCERQAFGVTDGPTRAAKHCPAVMVATGAQLCLCVRATGSRTAHPIPRVHFLSLSQRTCHVMQCMVQNVENCR